MAHLILFLVVLISFPAMAQLKLFDNFLNNPSGRWEFITDQVMGGISTGRVDFISEGVDSYARMTGNVSLENNGGFIQFRREVEIYFGEASEGLKLKVRGNNQQYFVHIRTTGTFLPWLYYQAPISTTREWQLVKVPFSNFARSSGWFAREIPASKIRSIGIVAFGKEHDVKIDVKNIAIY